MPLNKTYELVKPPVPAIDWQSYEALVFREWADLLKEQERSPNERQIQQYLERHPCLLPWVEGELGVGHHGCFPAAVITQPKLSGLSAKYPDFMWIARDSVTVYPVLIEIETPMKPWFTKSGQPHNTLTQAINQLREWKQWFSSPANLIKFKKQFALPSWLEGRAFQPRYVLIYGSRRDQTLNARTNPRRAIQNAADEIFLTFDRLAPHPNLRNYLTVRLDKDGYRAVSVPATLELGPFYAEFWSLIRGKGEALEASPHLSDERRRFLVERWPYWDEWARREDKGMRSSGDRE